MCLNFYLILAKHEEQKALQEFGKEYQRYMERTPAWIPKFSTSKSELFEEKSMRNLIASLIIISLISAPVFATEKHQHNAAEEKSSHGMPCSSMHSMSHEQKMTMHKKMEKMKTAMAKIKSEKNIKKRESLMQEQMKSMEDHMKMMQEMAGEKDNSKADQHKHDELQ
jgi:hypothetical protein